jgi:NAD(P)-dependent dehydrogenase (short-subunit alcohol dehydrogenase family)
VETRGFSLSAPVGNTNEFRLDGKVAVVTGGGSGIGRAIALKFAGNGATIRILDISQKDAEAVAAEISSAGGTASAYACDVSNQQQVRT